MNMFELAEEMYTAYGQSAGWMDYGEPMHTWRNLPSDIQRHWCAAAQRVLTLFGKTGLARDRLPDHES